MMKLGLQECVFAELHPLLKQLLDYFIASDDQAELTYKKDWDGFLSAYVLTHRAALNVALNKKIGNTKSRLSIHTINFAEISSIKERFQYGHQTVPVYNIELIGAAPQNLRLLFSFISKDPLYNRFLQALYDRIEMNQPGSTVCNQAQLIGNLNHI
jgi:hypothetical protein